MEDGITSFLTDVDNLGKSFVGITGSLGIAGFVFDVADESQVNLESEITDHYLENGSPVQDHIALRPERVTLRGYVGEYRYIKTGQKGLLQKTAEKLVTVASYVPVLSSFAKNTFSTLKSNQDALDKSIDIGLDLFETYRNINIPQDNQSQAFIFFEALRNSKRTFTVQTPYRYYTNMAIETIKATQTGTTKDESSFEVTLKKIRKTQVEVYDIEGVAKKLSNMAAKVVDKGMVKGVEESLGEYFR